MVADNFSEEHQFRGMLSRIKIVEGLEQLLQRIRATVADADAKDPIRQVFGLTARTAMDAFCFAYAMAMLVVYFARRWQSREPDATGLIAVIMRSPMRLLFTLALIAFWVYVLMRWLRYIGWPSWWALPYVLLVLCPWAWIFAYRIEFGGDSIALFLLQLPLIIVYLWRVHSRSKHRV